MGDSDGSALVRNDMNMVGNPTYNESRSTQIFTDTAQVGMHIHPCFRVRKESQAALCGEHKMHIKCGIGVSHGDVMIRRLLSSLGVESHLADCW